LNYTRTGASVPSRATRVKAARSSDDDAARYRSIAAVAVASDFGHRARLKAALPNDGRRGTLRG